jgi:hypothetical protein
MIVIEMEKTSIEYAYKFQEVCEENTGIISQKSFSGISEVVQIGINLTPIVLPFVAGVIIEMIRNNKKVKIKTIDVEIENLSENNALKILEQLFEKNKKTKGKK